MASMLYWRFSRSIYTFMSIRFAFYRPLVPMIRNFHEDNSGPTYDFKSRMRMRLLKENASNQKESKFFDSKEQVTLQTSHDDYSIKSEMRSLGDVPPDKPIQDAVATTFSVKESAAQNQMGGFTFNATSKQTPTHSSFSSGSDSNNTTITSFAGDGTGKNNPPKTQKGTIQSTGIDSHMKSRRENAKPKGPVAPTVLLPKHPRHAGQTSNQKADEPKSPSEAKSPENTLKAQPPLPCKGKFGEGTTTASKNIVSNEPKSSTAVSQPPKPSPPSGTAPKYKETKMTEKKGSSKTTLDDEMLSQSSSKSKIPSRTVDPVESEKITKKIFPVKREKKVFEGVRIVDAEGNSLAVSGDANVLARVKTQDLKNKYKRSNYKAVKLNTDDLKKLRAKMAKTASKEKETTSTKTKSKQRRIKVAANKHKKARRHDSPINQRKTLIGDQKEIKAAKASVSNQAKPKPKMTRENESKMKDKAVLELRKEEPQVESTNQTEDVKSKSDLKTKYAAIAKAKSKLKAAKSQIVKQAKIKPKKTRKNESKMKPVAAQELPKEKPEVASTKKAEDLKSLANAQTDVKANQIAKEEETAKTPATDLKQAVKADEATKDNSNTLVEKPTSHEAPAKKTQPLKYPAQSTANVDMWLQKAQELKERMEKTGKTEASEKAAPEKKDKPFSKFFPSLSRKKLFKNKTAEVKPNPAKKDAVELPSNPSSPEKTEKKLPNEPKAIHSSPIPCEVKPSPTKKDDVVLPSTPSSKTEKYPPNEPKAMHSLKSTSSNQQMEAAQSYYGFSAQELPKTCPEVEKLVNKNTIESLLQNKENPSRGQEGEANNVVDHTIGDIIARLKRNQRESEKLKPSDEVRGKGKESGPNTTACLAACTSNDSSKQGKDSSVRERFDAGILEVPFEVVKPLDSSQSFHVGTLTVEDPNLSKAIDPIGKPQIVAKESRESFDNPDSKTSEKRSSSVGPTPEEPYTSKTQGDKLTAFVEAEGVTVASPQREKAVKELEKNISQAGPMRDAKVVERNKSVEKTMKKIDLKTKKKHSLTQSLSNFYDMIRGKRSNKDNTNPNNNDGSRRTITTYAAARTNVGKSQQFVERWRGKKEDRQLRKVGSRKDIFISPDVQKQGLGADNIRKERREAKKRAKVVTQEESNAPISGQISVYSTDTPTAGAVQEAYVDEKYDPNDLTKIRGGSPREMRKNISPAVSSNSSTDLKAGPRGVLEQQKRSETGLDNIIGKREFSSLAQRFLYGLKSKLFP